MTTHTWAAQARDRARKSGPAGPKTRDVVLVTGLVVSLVVSAGTAEARVTAGDGRAATAPLPSSKEASAGAFRWPAGGAIVGAWVAPAHRYASGHRGVDLAIGRGDRVVAMAAGRVGFAGPVAGRSWVSIDHPNGIRTTVGPMATIVVARGQVVEQDQAVGTAAATAHASANQPTSARLHVSARRHGDYIDPTTLVGGLVATLVGPPLPAS